jgi:hypothetical protein
MPEMTECAFRPGVSFRLHYTTNRPSPENPAQRKSPIDDEAFSGGTAGDRTRDQTLKRRLLYQLSYRPENVRTISQKSSEIVTKHLENGKGWRTSRRARNFLRSQKIIGPKTHEK